MDFRGVEKSLVQHERQAADCGHCGSPIEMGMSRWLHVGTSGDAGTFAVGCCRSCCVEAAITLQEHYAELREAQQCEGS